MRLKKRFHLFNFSKGFILVLSSLFAVAFGLAGSSLWESPLARLLSSLVGLGSFIAVWMAYYALIFRCLKDGATKGEKH